MMKKIFLSVLFGFGLFAQERLFHEDFEHIPAKFPTLEISRDNPGNGLLSGHLTSPQGQQSDIALAGSAGLIEVEPDTWYRMKVRSRTDIKAGEIKFGVFESRSAKKQQSGFEDWRWKNIPLNITEWRNYELEFKTAPNTRGIQLFLRTENCHSGSSWWDDIGIERFHKENEPLILKPFPAAATFVDIPTRQAYVITEGDPKKIPDRQHKSTYHWKTIDPAKERLALEYFQLPDHSELKVRFFRGGNTLFSETRKAAGTGNVHYDLKLNSLPEGIYIFKAELIVAGKVIRSREKEIWRIDSRKSRTPRHEPVRRVTTDNNRQRRVNGKIFNPVYNMTSPTWGLFYHHKKFCKPDLSSYIRTLQEQFGQDLFTVWAWRGKQWDGKSGEWVQYAVRNSREYMDFLAASNCYARASIVFGGYKRFPLDFDQIRSYIRGIKDHPALLEYAYDEPEFRFKPEEMLKIRKLIREEDPGHPVNINLCQPDRFHEYAPSSDIASFDIYPFPGASLIENRKRTAKLLAAYPAGTPFDSYLQMFNFNTLPMPTFDQIRAAFLLDRINGSNSLIAYAWGEMRQSFQTDPELQSYYRAIVSMFRRLGPILNHGRNFQLKLIASDPCIASRAVACGGEKIVMLVNVSPDTPAKVNFQCKASKAENFFDPAWQIHSRCGVFSLQLKPLETRVLRLVE